MNTPSFEHLSKLTSLTPHTIYLVGGSVRDLVIGIQNVKDIDLIIHSGSEHVARAFADKISGSFFVLDEERRITRVVKRQDREMLQFDFSDFEGPDLAADLGRRDFTMNAMAIDLREFIKTGSLAGIVDPFNGREDLKKSVIRSVKAQAFDHDPLRLLRAVRFAATLGFTIEPETADQIRKRAGLVSNRTIASRLSA